MHIWRYRTTAVAGLVLLAACADKLMAPNAPLGPAGALLSSGGGGGPPLFSNSRQYRPQTMPHQSNRSGSATLTSRALLGKDGNTVLEVTTGALGASSAPGNISKLQLKISDQEGTLMPTRNFNGLSGGYQTLTFGGLPRHGHIQTQGNVRDIDPKRTDVVTIKERINFRPDLAVVDLMAPERVRPGETFVVTANISELNQDVGAHNDCVLYADGAEQERSVGVWVADGDMVTCAFQHSFANPGTYTLSMKSENVNPGDWDLANNSASRSIEVVNPEVQLHGWAFAQHSQWSYRHLNTYRWWYDNYPYSGQYEYRVVSEGGQSWAYFYGSAPGGGPISSTSMKIKDANGVTAASVGGPAGGAMCSYQWAANGYDWLYTCSSQWVTTANGGHYAGRAVYYGRHFYQACWYGSCYTYYDYSWNYNNSWGTGVASQGAMTFDVRIEGTNGTIFVANPTVTMQYSYSFDYSNQPLQCGAYDDPPGYYYGFHSRWCSEYVNKGSHQYGWVNF